MGIDTSRKSGDGERAMEEDGAKKLTEAKRCLGWAESGTDVLGC
jgi:hypothetical protein